MPHHAPSSAPSGSPLHALQSSLRPSAKVPVRPPLLIAGATGALGSEVLRRLAGSGRFSHAEVLAREPMATGLAQVSITLAPEGDPAAWAVRPLQGATAVVMFEPPRLFYDRERALWTPSPEQLPALARWLRRCGAQTLVVVMPRAQGRLPDALKRGLANVDEHDIAALGFDRLLLVRSAQKPAAQKSAGFLRATAAWMLSTLSYMIPQTEQPVRPSKLAEFVEAALCVLPEGTHVAAPELLWQAGQSPSHGRQGDMHSVVQAWLNTAGAPLRG